MYGRVSPHNLVLQIAFEIGIAGLAIYIWLWVTVIGKMYKMIRARLDPDSHNFILGSIGVIISYTMVNVTNAYWQESYGMMIFLFMALILVIHREYHEKEL